MTSTLICAVRKERKEGLKIPGLTLLTSCGGQLYKLLDDCLTWLHSSMGVMLKILARHCRRELSRPCVHAPHRFRPFGVSFQQVVGFSTKPSHSSPPKPQQAPFNNHHKPKPPKQKLRMSFTPGANAVSVVTGTGEIARCNINLTETECQVFSLLVEVTGSYPELAKTTVRVAGGWVRDKVRLQRFCDVNEV